MNNYFHILTILQQRSRVLCDPLWKIEDVMCVNYHHTKTLTKDQSANRRISRRNCSEAKRIPGKRRTFSEKLGHGESKARCREARNPANNRPWASTPRRGFVSRSRGRHLTVSARVEPRICKMTNRRVD